MFGPSKETLALREQLATAAAQLQQSQTATASQRKRCQELEASLAAEEEKRKEVETLLRSAEARLTALQENLQRLAGKSPSPFIKIAGDLILFTKVDWITPADGHVSKINGRDCWDSAVLVEDLERLVSAHYRRVQTPAQE